ncbi:hypothetical protein VCRA2126O298_170059 [Vibrio crassostreae]|nr:hypothetical protein VCRA2126O293_140090 [Vibrio crassostreae]CAK3107357.1 hypothetical protein VCRA2123O280_130037 [Vibrio crassostreae]CAK3176391.1 hypothetical protein VCRA2126O292_110091 [Vibrio crassostreae]CAK3197889.1 hypothetical protein VCRA2126O298_170059 [Vibrio crassostreae]CAK3210428.1 hypothetical protein VCRA2126O295_130036 [Vibrio crassostreae]
MIRPFNSNELNKYIHAQYEITLYQTNKKSPSLRSPHTLPVILVDQSLSQWGVSSSLVRPHVSNFTYQTLK